MTSVSRPKTVMNQGIPAAGSWPGTRGSSSIRSEARSATDCLNVTASSSQEACSCGMERCHAESEERTRESSSPNFRSACATATRTPFADGMTSARRRHACRGSSAME